MEDFEERLHDLFARKALPSSVDFVPSLRDSLEALLDHVCEKVLAPAYYILTEQAPFSSSLFKSHDGNIGDALGDGMADRRVVSIRIARLQEPLFDYLLSFDGDHAGGEAGLYRKVVIIDNSEFTLGNTPPPAADSEQTERVDADTPDEPSSDQDASHSIKEYAAFPTLDLAEVVRLVQEDFYLVCDTLL